MTNGLVLMVRGKAPMLWAPNSSIAVLANHSISSSVNCYGPPLRSCPTIQPQYCLFREL